jgi:hypothetical protein
VMHCMGPLEHPVFSGSAVAVCPPPAVLSEVEENPALAAMMATPGAIAAFDKVCLSSRVIADSHAMPSWSPGASKLRKP